MDALDAVVDAVITSILGYCVWTADHGREDRYKEGLLLIIGQELMTNLGVLVNVF